MGLNKWDIGVAYVRFEGTNEGKRRPILIIKISNNKLISFKITTKFRDDILEYPIKQWREAGLNKQSYIRLKHKAYFSDPSLITKIGTLQEIDIKNVEKLCKNNNISLTESLSKLDIFTLLESKKMQNIPVFKSIEDQLKWVKKKQKSPLITFNPDAGNVEVQNTFFNTVIGGGDVTGAEISLGESLEESQNNRSKLVWYENNGKCPAKEFLRSCDKMVRATMARLIYKLEHGIQFNKNENKFLQDGIFELRTESTTGWYRLTYFYPGDSTFVVLSGFKKKSNKTPSDELIIAIQRKKDYLRRLK